VSESPCDVSPSSGDHFYRGPSSIIPTDPIPLSSSYPLTSAMREFGREKKPNTGNTGTNAPDRERIRRKSTEHPFGWGTQKRAQDPPVKKNISLAPLEERKAPKKQNVPKTAAGAPLPHSSRSTTPTSLHDGEKLSHTSREKGKIISTLAYPTHAPVMGFGYAHQIQGIGEADFAMAVAVSLDDIRANMDKILQKIDPNSQLDESSTEKRSSSKLDGSPRETSNPSPPRRSLNHQEVARVLDRMAPISNHSSSWFFGKSKSMEWMNANNNGDDDDDSTLSLYYHSGHARRKRENTMTILYSITPVIYEVWLHTIFRSFGRSMWYETDDESRICHRYLEKKREIDNFCHSQSGKRGWLPTVILYVNIWYYDNCQGFRIWTDIYYHHFRMSTFLVYFLLVECTQKK